MIFDFSKFKRKRETNLLNLPCPENFQGGDRGGRSSYARPTFSALLIRRLPNIINHFQYRAEFLNGRRFRFNVANLQAGLAPIAPPHPLDKEIIDCPSLNYSPGHQLSGDERGLIHWNHV